APQSSRCDCSAPLFSRPALCLSSPLPLLPIPLLFFFNDTSTTEIYTLSLHDALPILARLLLSRGVMETPMTPALERVLDRLSIRSEEHTSELQSLTNLVCRLLLEKKKTKTRAKSARANEAASPPRVSNTVAYRHKHTS